MNFKDSTIFLVTGGAGFIGSNLCEAILSMGNCKVRCLDDLSTGKWENVDMFIDNPNYTFLQGDICDFDICARATQGVDYVLHQAALGSVNRSIKFPLLYEKVNVAGTLNMMEASVKNGIKKFVYASSSSVYGDSAELPKKEGIEGRSLSPYAVTKSTCEDYGYLYKSLYGLDTYGLRYFNVFGKRQDPNSEYAAVIPLFIKQILNDEQPVIFGDGMQSRDFTYITNVVEANLRACKATSEVAGQIFNIAYGERTRLIDMYNTLTNVIQKDILPLFSAERVGDIKHSHADITKAKELLGYEPQCGFSDGISAAIEWYKSQEQK